MTRLDCFIADRILPRLAPAPSSRMDGSAYARKSKLETLLGTEVWQSIRGKVVIDFGCGAGAEAIEMAQRGARHVYGVDISDRWLRVAREQAQQSGCQNVTFARTAEEKADVVVSLDAFEHFEDPGAILQTMHRLLKPEGTVMVSFGPTWYHPLGGHLFSIFPWAHLIFSEAALCRWRSNFKTDGAKRFCEVEGGLNQMTISRFEAVVAASPFSLESLDAVPIRKFEKLHNRLTREFLTAIVRCRLRPRTQTQANKLGVSCIAAD
jgi:SAM-dependent methyltransferase